MEAAKYCQVHVANRILRWREREGPAVDWNSYEGIVVSHLLAFSAIPGCLIP